MNIPTEEQLEAYTTWTTRELFARYGITTDDQGLFTADHRDVRTLFSFSRAQLVEFLRAHPERAHACLERGMQLLGIYDQSVLERDGGRYVLYWQDHGGRRDPTFYDDLFEAAADWLRIQYGM